MDEFSIKMLENQQAMAVDIKEIKVSLDYHIKRTNLLEESIGLAKQQLEIDLKPIKAHVALLNIVLKLGGALSFILVFIAGVLKILDFLK